MAGKASYHTWLKQDLGGVIDTLAISTLQKRFLHSRWLDQVLWMGGQATQAQTRYYTLRLITIIGGVIVPASLSWPSLIWLTWSLSLLVAISAAVEEFFHYGERWRHYRRTVERLKIAGWQFFQLSGLYSSYQDHAVAFSMFVMNVEEVLQQEVEVYIAHVVQEQQDQIEKAKATVADLGQVKMDDLAHGQPPTGVLAQRREQGAGAKTEAQVTEATR